MECILCGASQLEQMSLSDPGAPKSYFRCHRCALIFLEPRERLANEIERARYLQHRSDTADTGYENFVRPLVERICALLPPGASGLDFGSGHGTPAPLSHFLRAKGYEVQQYDPYFHPDPGLLERTYDFVVACEVVEHFHHPRQEFTRLKSLLRPKGWLAIMTHLTHAELNFASWYYRRDPTHVAFYSPVTFAWIAREFGFENPEIEGQRLVTMKLV